MKPASATVTVSRPREEVFDFLDVLGNHERFTDHSKSLRRLAYVLNNRSKEETR